MPALCYAFLWWHCPPEGWLDNLTGAPATVSGRDEWARTQQAMQSHGSRQATEIPATGEGRRDATSVPVAPPLVSF